MMTIMQIMRNVDFGRRERAEYVRIFNFRQGFSKKTGLPKTVSRAYSKRQGYTSVHRYACAVDCLDKKSHVMVSCSCPDFCFRHEYMLMTMGAAVIRYGNGEAPQDPHPPGCCKHLVMTFKEMLNQGILDNHLKYKVFSSTPVHPKDRR
jgi:hypothetical protein